MPRFVVVDQINRFIVYEFETELTNYYECLVCDIIFLVDYRKAQTELGLSLFIQIKRK